jgi:hypothetical protein
MNRLGKRLRSLWRRRQLDRDLEDELRFHLEMKTEEVSDRAEAQRRVGNATAIREACRELWTFSRIETWWQDIRYAIRMLAKTPDSLLLRLWHWRSESARIRLSLPLPMELLPGISDWIMLTASFSLA